MFLNILAWILFFGHLFSIFVYLIKSILYMAQGLGIKALESFLGVLISLAVLWAIVYLASSGMLW